MENENDNMQAYTENEVIKNEGLNHCRSHRFSLVSPGNALASYHQIVSANVILILGFSHVVSI